MRTPSHPARAGSAHPLAPSVLALLCAGLWCATPQAAPERAVPIQQLLPANATPNPNPAPTAGSASRSSGATAAGVAVGSVVALGLWQAWRVHRAEAGAPPVAIIDPDHPIPMDGVTTVGELEDYSARRLMDTLRELRANKHYDCDHGRSAQDFFCEKIRLVKAALGLKGVTFFGDEANDGCGCR